MLRRTIAVLARRESCQTSIKKTITQRGPKLPDQAPLASDSLRKAETERNGGTMKFASMLVRITTITGVALAFVGVSTGQEVSGGATTTAKAMANGPNVSHAGLPPAAHDAKH